MKDTELVRKFYEAFASKNAEEMVSYYDDEIVFNDPVFKDLKGEEAHDMWRMLLERGKDLKIKLKSVEKLNNLVIAHWQANYTFSKNRRKIENHVKATILVKDGKIHRHKDEFDFWKWQGEALGLMGYLFGWTPLLKNKIRKTARYSLSQYRKKKEND